MLAKFRNMVMFRMYLEKLDAVFNLPVLSRLLEFVSKEACIKIIAAVLTLKSRIQRASIQNKLNGTPHNQY